MVVRGRDALCRGEHRTCTRHDHDPHLDLCSDEETDSDLPTPQLWISSTHPNAPAKIYPLPSSTSFIQQTLQTISPAYFGKTLSSYLGENPQLLGKAGEKFAAPVEAGKGERFLPFLMKVLTCKQGEEERCSSERGG